MTLRLVDYIGLKSKAVFVGDVTSKSLVDLIRKIPLKTFDSFSENEESELWL